MGISSKYLRLLILYMLLLILSSIGLIHADELPVQKGIIVGDQFIGMQVYGSRDDASESYPKIALVLSGGGARGFAHIPVIEAIEKVGIPIDMVLGTSMGSLVGGLYSAGYSPGDMRRLIASYNMVELFALAALPPLRPDPAPLRRDRDNLFVLGFDSEGLGGASGIIGDQRILSMLNDSLSRVSPIDDFNELAIPFRCIGTDLVTGERVVFSEGSLVSAIRSSISIPVVFTPYPTDGRLIIDGGLVDNMPVHLARDMGADIVIAVDVNAVDYTIEAEEMESLTDILSQLIVILTKNTVVYQSTDADLLIEPQLDQHDILDFAAVDEIIAVGEATAISRHEDIQTLAQKIGAFRTLVPLDPDRYGAYFTLPDVYVNSVSHRTVGSYQDEGIFNLEQFDQFVGKPLDLVSKRKLRTLFEELRIDGGYATVAYDYTDAFLGKSDTVRGNLEIQTRKFEPKRSSISAGLNAAVSYAWTSSNESQFRMLPDFSVRYTNNQFFDSTSSLEVLFAASDATTISSKLKYGLTPNIQIGTQIGYVTGGIHPLNLRYALTGVEDRDRMMISEFFLEYRYNSHHVLKLATDFDYIWYGEQVVGRDAFIPSARFDGVYTTIPFGFFPKSGSRMDFSFLAEAPIEGNNRFGYRMETRLQKVLSLGANDALWFDAHAGTSHVSNPRKTAYFDYGGSRGIPSYPALSLVDDMILARVKHLHHFSAGMPTVILQSMVTVSSRGLLIGQLLSDTDPYNDNSGLPFSSLGGFEELEYSGSIALGLSTATIDFLFGLALDNNLRLALFFEVL